MRVRSVNITFTEHGIPHVLARDYYGLGYGYGYAAAMVDVCAVAETFVDARGRRAESFDSAGSGDKPPLGQPAPNAVSDLATRLLAGEEAIRIQRAGLSGNTRDLIEGYAAGYDRYLEDTPRAKLPRACRDAEWVRPISADDLLARVAVAVHLTGAFDQELFDAKPPGSPVANRSVSGGDDEAVSLATAGSNAYAFGSMRTANGRGLLLGNPHWFWSVPNRFMEAHLTIPGVYDVMGVSVVGMPLINIGFNRSLAWTHTVATDARGTLFELQLDPADPTRYLVDGRSHPMNTQRIEVRVRDPNGALRTVSHEFWITEYGPIVESSRLPWSRTTAYALADSGVTNNRYLRQQLELGTSKDVRQLKRALAHTMGLVWVNTVAADASGEALYADFSVIPNVPKALYVSCAKRITFAQARLVNVMDGSRSACQWSSAHAEHRRGIMPASQKPWLLTREYVENSNDSHWFVNPETPLEGFSPIIGPERAPLNLRTRLGHVQIRQARLNLDGDAARLDIPKLEEISFSNRDYFAELVLDDLLSACAATHGVTMSDGRARDLTEECQILARWDRRDDLTSVGAQLFREFTREVKPQGAEDTAAVPAFWRTPFDPERPLETPAGLNTATAAPLEALARASDRLEKAGIPANAPLGDIQFIERAGKRIALPGGFIFNRISPKLTPGIGYTEPMGSADSYIQVVTFDGTGPVADILLVHSQSTNPDSNWYADQAELYARKQWVRAPFNSDDIAAHRVGEPITLQYRPR
jgi:acyl-homoserine-lactone acylase